uniref:Nuclear pore localisation protein NPL4 C-terminal domain-containing protein n=1 Tax=Hemiselmis tepida TaxID=464990 RepID=A0A7S0Z2R2_9CRYP
MLGMRRVGWVFTARGRKCILSGGDVKLACELQEGAERRHGFDFARSFVSAVITRNDTTGSVVFEAYQVSDLAQDMHKRGVIKAPAGSNKGYARTTENVLVERKDSQKVDTDFFLNTVPIKTHTSALFGGREGEFPVENRPGAVQNGFEVKHILKCHEEMPFSHALRDFHMLIFLAKHTLDPVHDLPALCRAVVSGEEPPAGHRSIIETLAQQPA